MMILVFRKDFANGSKGKFELNKTRNSHRNFRSCSRTLSLLSS